MGFTLFGSLREPLGFTSNLKGGPEKSRSKTATGYLTHPLARVL